MDSVNCATSAAGPLAKRPLRETGDFLLIVTAPLKPQMDTDAHRFLRGNRLTPSRQVAKQSLFSLRGLAAWREVSQKKLVAQTEVL
jgi:hypothetical protein